MEADSGANPNNLTAPLSRSDLTAPTSTYGSNAGRSFGTSYQNTSGKAQWVNFDVYFIHAAGSASTNEVALECREADSGWGTLISIFMRDWWKRTFGGVGSSSLTDQKTLRVLVPPNWYYRLTDYSSANAGILAWFEVDA